MNRIFATVALAALIASALGSTSAPAAEPKATKTVDLTSTVVDLGAIKALEGTGVILSQREWERLAAAWGITAPAKVDFSKELLLVGTWRGSGFKILSDVKDGNLTAELVGDKDIKPGFRFKVMSLQRDGITSFQGKALPKE